MSRITIPVLAALIAVSGASLARGQETATAASASAAGA